MHVTSFIVRVLSQPVAVVCNANLLATKIALARRFHRKPNSMFSVLKFSILTYTLVSFSARFKMCGVGQVDSLHVLRCRE